MSGQDEERGGSVRRGSAELALLRNEPALYAEDGGLMEVTARGTNRPNPRTISNAFDQPESTSNSAGASDWLWQWAQFIDHDIAEVNMITVQFFQTYLFILPMQIVLTYVPCV